MMRTDSNKDFVLDEQLYEKNRQFVAKQYPALAVKLAGLSALRGKLVRSEGSLDGVNLLVGAQTYFPDDVWTTSRQQIAEMDTDFSNMYSPFGTINHALPRLDSSTSLQLTSTICKPIWDFVRAKNFDPAKAKVERFDSAHAVVFGLGLGALFHRLVHETQIKYILIVEESFEILHHTLFIVDFAELFEKIEERGGKIELRIQKIEENWVELCIEHLKYNYFSFVQCGRIFINDYNVTDSASFSVFSSKLASVTGTKGFFEDQMIMMRNFSNNIYRQKTPLFMPKSIQKPELPCFIIANGPSLENCISLIEQHQDKAVIVSCGTALSALLARDIRPDIHVELENTELVSNILHSMHEQYGLDGIILVATSTLHKNASKPFTRALMYHRSGMTHFLHPAQLIASRTQTEPTVSNLGIAVAGYLGFSDVYLLGVDMGSVNVEKWHASKSVYEDPKLFKEAAEGKDCVLVKQPIIPHDFPANFGGVARTSDLMQMSQGRLEIGMTYFQRHFDCRYFNCSDGMTIKGTIPKLPSAVRLDVAADAKENFMRIFAEAEMQVDDISEPGTHFDKIMNPDFIRESFNSFRAIIEEYGEPVLPDTVHPQFRLFSKLEETFETVPKSAYARESQQFHGYIISGSVYRWTQMYVMFDSYLPKELRAEFAEVWLRAFLSVFDAMEEALLALAAEFDDVRRERLENYIFPDPVMDSAE